MREVMRADATDEQLRDWVRKLWSGREDRYSETRSQVAILKPKVEMSYIGG